MRVEKVASPAVQSKILPTIWLSALICVAVLSACESPPPDNRRALFATNLDAIAINALGEPVTLRQFTGKYVWIDYAAEWCAACGPQSRTIRSLVHAPPERVVFLTIMTSEIGGYGHPATRDTAFRWAKRLSLEPDKVLAADATAMMLPQHALFSPSGKELFRHVGNMTAADIRKALAEKIRSR
jgi:hypothetical protein